MNSERKGGLFFTIIFGYNLGDCHPNIFYWYKMNNNDTYEVEVRLWNERDLDALYDALKKPWENTRLGLYKKTGFAGNAKCVISDDEGYLCIRFEGKKDTSSKASEPRIPSYVQTDYMSAVKDLKQLIEQRKQEEEDLTTNPIP